jgi:hypothetical protein
MKNIALIASGLLVASTAAASANSIDVTQNRQANRIEYGRQTGKITWTEGLKLRAEQNRISRVESNYKSDGYLSKSERRDLRERQDAAAEHIAEKKNNGWSRLWWLPRVGR